MADEPVFSIVIPTYNYADYLACAIDSVIQQGRDDVEIIVVDDASTDQTADVVAEYGDLVHYERLPQNQGPASAWSVGLRLARGLYVCKLDADDWQLPGFLDEIEAVFVENPHVGAVYASVFLYTDGAARAQEYRVTTQDSEWLAADAFRARLLQEFFMRMPGAVLRRRCLEDQPLPIDELYIGHDWEYFLRVLRGWDVMLLGQPKAVYRVHPGSVTQSAVRLQRIEKDFGHWLELARRRHSPYAIDETERRELAFGMATSLMRIVGFPAWKSLADASFFAFLAPAFRLAGTESRWLGIRLAAYLLRRLEIKLFHLLVRRRTSIVPSVNSTSLLPVQSQ